MDASDAASRLYDDPGEHGLAEVRLRSGLHRTDAHEFYKSIGYTLAKTSHMFRKELTGLPL